MYIFKVFFSKSQADLLCFIWVLLKYFPYLLWKFFFLLLFYLNSILEKLIICFILNYLSFKLFLLKSPLAFFLEFEFVLFAFLFLNQVLNSNFLLFISVILSLFLSIFSYIELKKELTFNLLFLKNSIKIVLIVFCYLYWRFNYITIRLR